MGTFTFHAFPRRCYDGLGYSSTNNDLNTTISKRHCGMFSEPNDQPTCREFRRAQVAMKPTCLTKHPFYTHGTAEVFRDTYFVNEDGRKTTQPFASFCSGTVRTTAATTLWSIRVIICIHLEAFACPSLQEVCVGCLLDASLKE